MAAAAAAVPCANDHCPQILKDRKCKNFRPKDVNEPDKNICGFCTCDWSEHGPWLLYMFVPLAVLSLLLVLCFCCSIR